MNKEEGAQAKIIAMNKEEGDDGNIGFSSQEEKAPPATDIDSKATKLLVSGHSVRRRLHRFSSSKALLAQNRHRLGRLLGKLARAHNWKEASGVLSVYLQGTPRGSSLQEDRRNLLVAMEILKRLLSGGNYEMKIRKVYEIWMSKLTWMKKNPKKRESIHLELALFYLSQGNIQEAHNTMKFLIQDDNSASEPVVNLIYGLILYHLWYSGLPSDMQIKYGDIHISFETHDVSASDGYEEPEMESSNEHNAIDIGDVKYSSRFDSESSAGNEKNIFEDSKNVVKKQSGNIQQGHEFYLSGSEMDGKRPSNLHHQYNSSLFFAHGLEKSLLPLQLNQLSGNLQTTFKERKLSTEQYTDAVKHMRLALHSTPPMLAALQPLVQLLLLGDNVEEAIAELEESCCTFDAALPFRLRARILECVHSSQEAVISSCYEEALKRDPTCSQSIERLIKMHRTGSYNTLQLLEKVSMHLDAVDGSSIVWGEFALCFLKLRSASIFDYEDRTSANVQEGSAGILSTDKVHRAFTEGQARYLWKVRCRWWMTRHFSKDAYLKEVQISDWKLLASKAAGASHMYGPNFDYVKSVFGYLKKEENNDQLLLLSKHMESSMNLCENLDRICSS